MEEKLMKKKQVKRLLVLAAAAMLALGMTACSSGGNSGDANSKDPEADGGAAGSGTLTGLYTSTQNTNFISAFPEYTFKQATFGVESIETYDDGTYCLTSTNTNYSGTLTFSDDGTHEEVPRGADTVKYYGTYTSEDEEGLLTLTLSAPTSVVACNLYTTTDTAPGYLNTDAWTDEMGAAVGQDGATMTAEEYLASVSYSEMDIIVDTMTDSFDYAVLTPAE